MHSALPPDQTNINQFLLNFWVENGSYPNCKKLKICETSSNILPFSLIVFIQAVIISDIFSQIQRKAKQIPAHLRRKRQNLTQMLML